MVVPSGTIREEFVKHSRHSTATLISLTCDPFGLIESLTGQARAPVWRPPVLSVPGLDFPHFEARDSLPSAPIAAIKPPISAKDVCLCIKCRFVIQKCPFFSGQIVVVLFVFIQIPASIVINFFFPAPPAPLFPRCRDPGASPARDDLSRVFRVGLGIRHLLRATWGGRRLPHPSLPSRLTMSPGCLSREFCAVFPAGRKNRTNRRRFSCRQENLSCGSPIFHPLSGLSIPSNAQPGVAVPRWHRHSCLCVLSSSENVETPGTGTPPEFRAMARRAVPQGGLRPLRLVSR